MKKNRFAIIIFLTLILFFSLIARPYSTKGVGLRKSEDKTENIAIIMDKSIVSSIKTGLDQYIKDIESSYSVTITQYNGTWTNCAQLRTFIQNLYKNSSINGVILIGNLPYALWEYYPGDVGPLPFYYEDLDGTFKDQNSDSIFDHYDWGIHEGPEIWVSWMRPDSNNVVNSLNNYFKKYHNYYCGNIHYQNKALVCIAKDWKNAIAEITPKLLQIYPTVVSIGGPSSSDVTAEQYLEEYVKQYEVTDVWSHADSDDQEFDEGTSVRGSEIKLLSGGSKLTVIWGCHAADFHKTPINNLTASYVFDNNFGLASIAATRSIGIEQHQLVYDSLNSGEILGDSFFDWIKFMYSKSFIQNRFPDENINKFMWGFILMGDPFLVIPGRNIGVRPSSPSNLAATTSASSVTPTWSPSTQGTYPISGYAIYRGGEESGKEDFSKPIATVDANITMYTDTSVELDTTYFYVVKAFDNQNPPNYSESSNEISAWIGNPEDFVGFWVNKDSETGGITKVNIRMDNGKFFIHAWGKCEPTDCNWGEESTNVSDADDGVLVVKWIPCFATKELKISISKNTTLKIVCFTHFTDNSGRTDYAESDYFARFTPSIPQNLQATSTANSITLTWTASTQGTYPIGGYTIYRGTSPGGESNTPIDTVDANTTSYTDKSIELNKTYYYVVKVFDNQNPPNYSEPSNEVSIEIKDTTPPTLTVNSPMDGTEISDDFVEISGSITDDLSGVASLTINGNNVSISSNGTFSYTVSNLTEGDNTITITATDKAGNKATRTITITYASPVQTTTIILQPDNPYMTVNGVSQEIDPGRGTKPVIIPKWSRTVVPIRAIVEALGGTISWNGTERKVTINFNGTTIELWIDNPKAEVNKEMEWIDENNHDVRPIIRNDRTMLPLRFVAESLGCKVDWDSDTRTITITYGG